MLTHTIQTNASSYVIIPKPHFSSREGIHSRCRRFGSIIHRYDRCCRSRWRWWSIDRDRRVFNSQTLGLRGRFWVFFTYKKIAWLNWDAKSWEEVLSVDTNNVIHLPRRSSKTCEPQFANSYRFKENYRRLAKYPLREIISVSYLYETRRSSPRLRESRAIDSFKRGK